MVKIFSELQLFGILLICLVLQSNAKDLATEMVTASDYGTLQVVLTLAVLPVTLYVLVVSVLNLKKDSETGAGQVEANPLPSFEEEEE